MYTEIKVFNDEEVASVYHLQKKGEGLKSALFTSMLEPVFIPLSATPPRYGGEEGPPWYIVVSAHTELVDAN